MKSTAADANGFPYSRDYGPSESWSYRLEEVCNRIGVERAALGILADEREVLSGYSAGENGKGSVHDSFPVFCISKLFTATLVSALVSKACLKFEDPISLYFPSNGITSWNSLLRDITLSQLLSHTHGLNNIDFQFAPVDSKGFIDCDKVFSAIQSKGRLFQPGRFYSYGVTGYILLGMVLEKICQDRFSHVLYNELFRHIIQDSTISFYTNMMPTVCPSNGADLNVSVCDLLRFMKLFLGFSHTPSLLSDQCVSEMFRIRGSLPGWSPTISGTCYAWRSYEKGWFGHNGFNTKSLMYVRVNPEKKTAVCVAASSNNGNLHALVPLLLGETYPDLVFSLVKSQPRIDPDMEISEDHPILGEYGDSLRKIFTHLEGEKLIVEIFTRPTRDSNLRKVHECLLYPAESCLFYLSVPFERITFLQLIKDNRYPEKCYLWDHDQLWPAA